MKKIALLTAAAFAAGCAGTGGTITEYGPDGRVVKVTETSESVVSSVVASTKNKTVAVYDNSFIAYLAASTATAEDPTPTLKCGIGQADRGLLTVPAGADLSAAPKIMAAMRAGETSVGATGVTYGGKTAAE